MSMAAEAKLGARATGRWASLRSSKSGKRYVVLAAMAALLLGGGVVRPHAHAADFRHFDADAVADAELQMWQAYYGGSRVRLFFLLTSSVREQFNLTWAEAIPVAAHFARAASRFYALRGDYEQVLPELEAGYRQVSVLSPEPFDPRAMARAELDWWVARRVPATDTPEQVGAAMAKLYARAYALPEDRVFPAALLRAQAADLRDRSGPNPSAETWAQIAALLHDSYRALRDEASQGATSRG